MKAIKVQKSTPWVRMEKRDWMVVGIITLVYAVVAFVRLGDFRSANTYMTLENRQQAIVELKKPSSITRIQVLPGPTRRSNLDFYFADEKREKWYGPYSYAFDGSFAWDEMTTAGTFDRLEGEEFPQGEKFAYVMIESNADGLGKKGGVDHSTLAEVAFRDGEDKIIPIKNYAFYDPVTEGSPTREEISGYDNLFDEQELVPVEFHHSNSAIFDEIYYNQTIKNFQNGEAVFETTHPQLGKYLMMIGTSLFGFGPFGWRFMGTLIGVLMVPLVYIFALQLFKKRFWGAFAAIVFAFDFMHFTQTRVATIDTYPTFFVMLMFLFMYRYACTSFYDTKFRKTLIPLFFSGLFFGLGVASKWPVLYGGVGLATIFFAMMIRRFFEGRALGKVKEFWKQFAKTCGAAVGFFVAIPLAIYVLSFVPEYMIPKARLSAISSTYSVWYDSVEEAQAAGHGLNNIFVYAFHRSANMFKFHSELDAAHPYQANWLEWATDSRPILYYIEYDESSENAEGISAFGNPAVWWMGIVAVLYGVLSVLKWLIKKLAGTDKENDRKVALISLFLLVGYLSQLLPWVAVTRATFIYHYFPSVIFLVLLIALMFKEARPLWWYKFKWPKWKWTRCDKRLGIAVAYLVVVVLLFAMFYPVIAGVYASREYIDNFLKWLPGWTLC